MYLEIREYDIKGIKKISRLQIRYTVDTCHLIRTLVKNSNEEKKTMTLTNRNYVNEVKGMINNSFTDEDLRDLNHYIIERLKFNRTVAAKSIKQTLSIGQKVEWTGRRGFQQGTITKVNRTKVVVDAIGGVRWTIPMTMIKVVK